MKKQYDAILFDLDDTILDFAASEIHALDFLHTYHFGSYIAKEEFVAVFRRINKELWDEVNRNLLHPSVLKVKRFEMLLEEMGVSFNIEEIRALYETHLASTIFWLEGAEKALLSLRKIFKMGIITNGLSSVQNKKYELMKGDELFDCFLISEEVGFSKPHPRIFEMAIEKMGVSKEKILMVGDSLDSDYKGALNAGIDFCWVIDPRTYEPQDHHPVFKVSSLLELENTLGSKV